MSVNSTSNDLVHYCSSSKYRQFIVIGFSMVKTILILPLSTFILHMGYQRWRQRRSFNAASHSDLFTYHLAAMEMFCGVGLVFYLCGLYSSSFALKLVGRCCFSLTFYAEMFFHLLTCVERYLAVVHPITYRGLRNARGVRIRNISIGCVWLLSFVLLVVYADLSGNDAISFMLFFLVFCKLVISFCSFSVLCVLIRPGPGRGVGEKEQVDQSKQRAFYTITTITTVQWFWFLSVLVVTTLSKSPLLSEGVACVLTASISLLNLPSCLVSPLLFLHRAGKLKHKKFNTTKISVLTGASNPKTGIIDNTTVD